MKKILTFFLAGVSGLPIVAQKKYYPPTPQDSILLEGKRRYMESSVPGGSSKRPNVILIVADDLGKFDLSVYGNLLVETPHIDRLAKEGALFTDGYATASVCSPSRAGLMTGRYQQRFGYHMQPHQRYPKNKAEWWLFKNLVNTSDMEPAAYSAYPHKGQLARNGLPQSEIALSELLKKNGYATAWIGKWHLGYEEPLLPKNFGFDYRYGFYEAYSLFADPKDKNVVNARINEFTDKVIWKGGRKGACAIHENEKEIKVNEYITYAFTNKAEWFMETHKDTPFFIYLPLSAPHTPYQAPKEIYDSLSHIQDHSKRVYYGMVVAMDKAIGRLMDKLEKLKLDDNTLIIFTSDNGAALYSRTVTNEPLAGGKMTFFEGGINVPFMMRYKNGIKEGTVVQYPVSQCDIFATVAAAAGIPLPADRDYDGVSLLSYANEMAAGAPHDALYWMADYNLAIRVGKYKLIVNTLDKTVDLYNLFSDRGETENLATSYTRELLLFREKLMAWAAQMPPVYWPHIMEYRILINGKMYRWAV